MSANALLCLLAAVTPPAADPPPDPAAAVATVIHVAADGSDVIRGNGFLIDAEGVLVTNYHVVVKAARLHVQLANGDVYDQVQVRALDPAGDLAVLKVPAFKTAFISLAPGPPLAIGDEVRIVPRPAAGEDPAPRPARVVARPLVAPGLELLVLDRPLDASAKGCPVLGPGGMLVGISTLTYAAGPDAGAAIGAARLAETLGGRLDRPLDLMDWSAWSVAGEDPPARRLRELGLERRLPNPAIAAERSLHRRLEMALEFDPTDLQAKTLLARAYLQRREYDKALAQVNEVLARRPSRLDALGLKGDVLHHQGAYDEARAAYREVVEKGHPPPHNYHRDLGAVLVGGVVHDHAIASCRGALALGAEELAYRPEFWSNDRFSVRYDRIRRATIKPAVKAGQSVHEFKLEFAGPVANDEKTWVKDDLVMRLADKEARENVAAYLREKGVPVVTE
jgi:tetratricopeptide (TPR) repeat protein